MALYMVNCANSMFNLHLKKKSVLCVFVFVCINEILVYLFL